jgi:hypothetical protein
VDEGQGGAAADNSQQSDSVGYALNCLQYIATSGAIHDDGYYSQE